jgi:hypothetical protein
MWDLDQLYIVVSRHIWKTQDIGFNDFYQLQRLFRAEWGELYVQWTVRSSEPGWPLQIHTREGGEDREAIAHTER